MKIPYSRTIKNLAKTALAIPKLKYEGWTFTQPRLNMYLGEYHTWQKYYLVNHTKPTLPNENNSLIQYKNIIDIGAGEGETAKFFLDHHAIKILCIEPDTKAFNQLTKNALKNKNIIIDQDIFRLQQIEEAYPLYDLIKIDIEGYEEELLQLPNPKTPIVCEVHGLQLADKFRKAGYHVITPSTSRCLSYAYWKCKPPNG